MPSALKQFKTRAFARTKVNKAYDDLAEEFAFLDEVLEARAESGPTQAEVAARVGTTQSAIARLESAARGDQNLMPPILHALVARCTLGEVCDALRGVFGVYRPARSGA